MTAYIPPRERLTFYSCGPGYDLYEHQTVTFILTDRAQINNRLTAESDDSQPIPPRSMGMGVAMIIDCRARVWISYVNVSVFLYPPGGDVYYSFDLRPYLEPATEAKANTT